jgi:hypothetical protein
VLDASSEPSKMGPVNTRRKRAGKDGEFRFRPSLFWDVDPASIDPRRHARYVIERILDLGDETEVRWLSRTYSRRRIRDTIASSRALHEKSRSLWKLVF